MVPERAGLSRNFRRGGVKEERKGLSYSAEKKKGKAGPKPTKS